MVKERQAKGRGAVSNRTGRFERHQREAADDGWDDAADPETEPTPFPTSLSVDSARTIIARNESPDIPFDRSVNPYRGCEHGCVYCFARPTHAFLGLSPGLDFETRLFHKPDAALLLERAFRKRGYRPAPLALGANTDPYQPVERRLGLTRSILETMGRFSHPVTIITKSDLVLRDQDLLAPLAARGLAHVAVSVTTLDRKLARTMEPRATTPARRIAAIEGLTAAGIPVAVLASPMIPGLNDHELETILETAQAAGATMANTILIRLPLEIAGLFTEWLRTHYPDRADRVLSLIRQCRGGALYQAEVGSRMRGRGPYADLLADRFAKACARLGLNRRRWDLRTDLFAVPPEPTAQLSLL